MLYIVLFLLIFSSDLFRKRVIGIKLNDNGALEINSKRKEKQVYFVIISLAMIMLLTLKHDYVGTDTQNYRLLYEMFSYMSFEEALGHIGDVSFVFMYKSFLKLGLSFRAVLFVQALFYISSLTFIIKKYSKLPSLSYWIFITFGFFIFATTMRQAIATTFILLAYDLIRKQKPIHFIVCVFIAATFHLTALIFLPTYWIDKFRFNKKTMSLIILIILLLMLFKDKLAVYMLSYSKQEYISSNTGGYFLMLYLGALLMLGYIYRKYFLVDKNNKMLFYMTAAALALVPMAKMNPAMFRITNYYQIFIILYIPNLIKSIPDKLVKIILTCSFIILGLFYFYFKLTSYGIRMHPYVFFWNNYPVFIPGLN